MQTKAKPKNVSIAAFSVAAFTAVVAILSAANRRRSQMLLSTRVVVYFDIRLNNVVLTSTSEIVQCLPSFATHLPFT